MGWAEGWGGALWRALGKYSYSLRLGDDTYWKVDRKVADQYKLPEAFIEDVLMENRCKLCDRDMTKHAWEQFDARKPGEWGAPGHMRLMAKALTRKLQTHEGAVLGRVSMFAMAVAAYAPPEVLKKDISETLSLETFTDEYLGCAETLLEELEDEYE